MKQLTHKGTNCRCLDPFYSWRIERMLKLYKVSKYYEEDCSFDELLSDISVKSLTLIFWWVVSSILDSFWWGIIFVNTNFFEGMMLLIKRI